MPVLNTGIYFLYKYFIYPIVYYQKLTYLCTKISIV